MKEMFLPPEGQYRYFRSKLSGAEAEAYDALLGCFLAHGRSVDISAEAGSKLSELLMYICSDVPEVFFVRRLHSSTDLLSRKCRVFPEYRFDRKECTDLFLCMEEKAGEISKGLIGVKGTAEKILYIHDCLVRSVTYRDPEAPYSHEAAGALIYGIAVCEGISKAFKFVSDRICPGINAAVVFGTAKTGCGAAENHAWNIVTVGRNSFHIDCTFDNTLSSGGEVRYDYFLLSDRQIGSDHFFSGLPECSRDNEFYQYLGCCADTEEELRSIIGRLSAASPLTVKLRDSSCDEDETDRIAKLAAECYVSRSGRSAEIRVSGNSCRSVYRIEVREYG